MEASGGNWVLYERLDIDCDTRSAGQRGQMTAKSLDDIGYNLTLR